MTAALARRLWRETDRRLLWKFAYNFGWKGMRAVDRFRRRARRGDRFPAFLIISLTNDCNLRCTGCWVTQTSPPVHLDPGLLRRLIERAKSKGSFFFGLLGGEPLLYPDLFEVMAEHPDCYFQLFTNGTLLTEEVAATMRRLGNVTPLVSIEGLEQVSDERRGGSEVYARAVRALEHCRGNRLVTGVATSVCRSNLSEVVTESFLEDLVRRGVHYVWYYIYRPVGPDPAPELSLSADEIVALRRFIVDARMRWPIIIVDAYWDHEGRALCPAAMGVSYHVNPRGDVEPCPPIQFALDNVGNGQDVDDAIAASAFLPAFRETATSRTRGCVLLEEPGALRELVERTGARDSSGRGTGPAELAALEPRPGHHLPGREIPERSGWYRFAKKHWFFGFGAYG